jgi:hypothetical protein
MAAQPRFADLQSQPQPALIALLRLAALECRVAPRASLRACALLHPSAGVADHVTMVARILPDALLRRPVIWRPGASERSFDEAWLLAIAQAIATGDADSERFLMRRRVRPAAIPILRLLLVALQKRLECA